MFAAEHLPEGLNGMGSPSSVPGFEHKVVVGLAEFVVSNNPAVILTTYSLGSCLGVTVYDPVARAGGLLHLMLPDSGIDQEKAAARPGMFVDSGVPALFRACYQLGAVKQRMVICVAGGAQIMDDNGYFNIGKRNYEALCALLSQHALRISAEQVGGTVNRTMFLSLDTGEVRLKVSGQTREVSMLCRNLTTT
jgi:chemotaxis protein CheD